MGTHLTDFYSRLWPSMNGENESEIRLAFRPDSHCFILATTQILDSREALLSTFQESMGPSLWLSKYLRLANNSLFNRPCFISISIGTDYTIESALRTVIVRFNAQFTLNQIIEIRSVIFKSGSILERGEGHILFRNRRVSGRLASIVQ